MQEIDGLSVGTRLLSPTGRIWTVRGVTPTGNRVVLATDGPDGPRGAVIDVVAARRMVRIDHPAAPAQIETAAPAAPDFARA